MKHIESLEGLRAVAFIAIFFSLKNHTPLEEGFFRPLPFNILLLQSWVPFSKYYFSFNGVTWYLSTTVFLYFSFPLLFRIVHSIGEKRTLILGIAGVWTLQFYISLLVHFGESEILNANFLTYIFPLYRLGSFSIGVLSAKIFLLSEKKQKEISTFRSRETFQKQVLDVPSSLLLIIILAFVFVSFTYNLIPKSFTFSLFFSLPVAVLIYKATTIHSLFQRLLSGKVLVRLGGITSQTFLIHQITLNAVKRLIEKFTLGAGQTSELCMPRVLSFSR